MSGAALARLLGTIVVIAIVTTLPASDGNPALARARTQARERVMYVSVYDSAKQQPVSDLGPDAFVIREDGVRREVLRVTRATTPLPITIVVDNSEAVAPAITDLRKALTAFLTGIE